MRIVIAALVLVVAINYWLDFHESSKSEINLQRKTRLNRIQQDSLYSAKFDSTRHRLDSVDLKLERLARASIYLDSCQQARTAKADRAERRGRFVGGLLRGLFPGL
jgi:hypothetical protein